VIRNLEVNFTSNKKISKTTIHKVVSEIRRELDFKVSSLVINLVTSGEITRINKKYLKHNNSTDIITFDYSKDRKNLDAEMYISVDDAEHNSKKYDVNFHEETIRLIVHGILHLTGYDDKGKRSRILMKKKEDLLVGKFIRIILK
jgi:rRNA maturation RNase YbeY